MELVLDSKTLGAGKDWRNGEDAASAGTDGMSWVARLVFAVAAVGAAWFIMSDGRFGEIASGLLGRTHSTALPGPLGTLLASLPAAG